MPEYVAQHGLQIGRPLYELLEHALPGTGVDSDVFWRTLADLVAQFTDRNAALIDRRHDIQQSLDDWHREHRGGKPNRAAYETLLKELGYITEGAPEFEISTTNVDPEISQLPGPQLVVPVTNARFALNAANARWGSLFDALYGADLIAETDGAEKSVSYNPKRGEKVFAWAAGFLDEAFPLNGVSHHDAQAYQIADGALVVTTHNGQAGLADPAQLAGYQGAPGAPDVVLLVNHGLHVEIQIDGSHPVGQSHPANVKDVVTEAAISTIEDFEDSVAAVDAEDKALVYSNWLGLMKGDLTETVSKGDDSFTRRLAADRTYITPDSSTLKLPGRSLMLARNVGHLMTTPAVLDSDGNEIYEGILDALCTAAIGIHDLAGNGPHTNSRAGSLYIVKPKMHGPEEVEFTCDLFTRVEQHLGLETNTLKVGVMDEERRTSINLGACIHAARERLIFINTGFLDRTGDEIHTSMQAGPMVPKGEMKSTPWLTAYENNNVDTGLAVGLRGRAQIGKGMWPAPDNLAAMMASKIGHPEAGANTAWVPSPTAATLHAIHYHRCDVSARQNELTERRGHYHDDLLTIPLLDRELTDDEIQKELDNNCQGILGYVVRWIDQGVGCSKVPDITDTPLMEDRATCRISSQHVANWLHHGIADRQQIEDTLQRMAAVVDRQNADDPAYRPMADDFEASIAFQAARDLIFKGLNSPSGYTEPALHMRRLQRKAADRAS
ncbi:malate synthase G [Salinisphaera sp. USBA-960]|nr:malate synthase G [Salifodinibacter halophilus]NNC26527.1 malate synthase G [Salifodinibacter halophilus]